VERLSQSPLYEHLAGVRAREANDCLSCHSDPAREKDSQTDPLSQGAKHEINEGVSCESCHGPAERWLAAHVQQGWRSRPAEEKAALGFIDTRHLPTRIGKCAQCHIGELNDGRGGPRRDVNHDLIAAGHPRLLWETAAYHALLPRHWRQPDNQAKLWAVGQASSAAAAAKLLADRAIAAERGAGVWPEFAEYQCAACHHHLQPHGPSSVTTSDGLRPGAAPWEDWHFARLDALTAGREGFHSIDADVTALRRTMPSVWEDATGPRELGLGLSRDLDELASALGASDHSPKAARALLKRMLEIERTEIATWNSSYSLLLASAALANPEEGGAGTEELAHVRDWLRASTPGGAIAARADDLLDSQIRRRLHELLRSLDD
jgi:hypothetical protein